MGVQNVCQVCKFDEEDVEYVFRRCSFSTQALQHIGVFYSPSNGDQSWKDWLASEFQFNNTCNARKLAVIFWALWHNRNQVYHNGAGQNIYGVVSFINSYLPEIRESPYFNSQHTKYGSELATTRSRHY